MTLLRNLTTFRSWCFVLSICWAEGVAAVPTANAAASDMTPCGSNSVAAVLETVRAMAQSKDLKSAYACLARAQEVHPNNRDLSFQHIHVLAWLGDHKGARAALVQWQPLDQEGHEVDGDLHWLAGDFFAAEQAYQLALNSKESIPPGEELKQKYKNAKAAVASYNGSLTGRAKSTAVLEVQRYLHSNELVATETRASTSYERSEWVGRVDVLLLTKHRGVNTTNGATMGVGVGRRWAPGQLSDVSIGTSLGKPMGAYRRMLAAHHEGFVSSNFYLGAELRASQFEAALDALGSVQAGVYEGNVHGVIKVYASKKALTTMLRMQYKWDNYTPEIWAASGRAEAIRPYLLEDGEHTAVFRVIGSKLAWSQRQGLGLFIDAEWRFEVTSFQKMLGGGATWAF